MENTHCEQVRRLHCHTYQPMNCSDSPRFRYFRCEGPRGSREVSGGSTSLINRRSKCRGTWDFFGHVEPRYTVKEGPTETNNNVDAHRRKRGTHRIWFGETEARETVKAPRAEERNLVVRHYLPFGVFKARAEPQAARPAHQRACQTRHWVSQQFWQAGLVSTPWVYLGYGLLELQHHQVCGLTTSEAQALSRVQQRHLRCAFQ